GNSFKLPYRFSIKLQRNRRKPLRKGQRHRPHRRRADGLGLEGDRQQTCGDKGEDAHGGHSAVTPLENQLQVNLNSPFPSRPRPPPSPAGHPPRTTRSVIAAKSPASNARRLARKCATMASS